MIIKGHICVFSVGSTMCNRDVTDDPYKQSEHCVPKSIFVTG